MIHIIKRYQENNIMHTNKSHSHTHRLQRAGFVLPTVLILSVILLTIGLSVFQLTSNIARSLTDQYWQRLARQSSQAGMAYLSACVDQGLSGSTWPTSITQNNTCIGTAIGTIPSIHTNTGDTNPTPNPYRTSFVVDRPVVGTDGIPKVRVVGTVEVLNTAGTTTIKTYRNEMTGIINGPTQSATKIVTPNGFSFASSCAISGSQAFCWGYNASGQIGDGTTTQRNTPVPVSTAGVLNNKVVTDLTIGTWFTCAVASSQAFCWGENAYGSLGDNTTNQRTTPVAVTTSGVLNGRTVTRVEAGGRHACAIADGQAFCWGANSTGQLGDSSTTQRTTPVTVTQAAGLLAGKVVTDISGGRVTTAAATYGTTCAIASSQAFCWGQNTNGQVGDSSTTQRTAPVAVTQAAGLLAGRVVTDISVGDNHTCAIAEGQAFCWGNNANGQLGDSSTTQRTAPVLVTQTAGILGGKVVTDISAGANSTCAIANGQAYCWGANTYGQLGDGTTSQRTSPVAVSTAGVLNGKVITDIGSNGFHACAIAEGQIYCWGRNQNGQLGNNTTTDSSLPLKSFNFF